MTKRVRILKRKRPTGPELSRTRSKYRFKPGFADEVRKAALINYRQKRGKKFELGGGTVLRSHAFLEDEAINLAVINTLRNEIDSMRVIRLTNVARLLDVSYQTLWRWTSETGQLPPPVLTDNSQAREYQVYHIEEVRIMVQVIGEHLNAFKYYRKDHEHTRSKLFGQIEALRATNFNIEDTSHGGEKKRPRPGNDRSRVKPHSKQGRNSGE